MSPTVLIVPGLRDHVQAHWQTLLAAQLTKVHTVPPMGREDLDCAKRVQAIEAAMAAIDGPVVLVAHSGGCVMVAHWAHTSQHAHRVVGALLATPPDFDQAMPEGYPTLATLQAGGWLPVPRQPLPFRSLVATSDNDPLAAHERVLQLARDWGSETVDLGAVGHLNPASGFGEWPMGITLIQQLSTDGGYPYT
ncbi:RBBP9/YdeN family alpha/beta hydrolase [Limnohabitans radicicola]|uniref:Alpha/beta fold hydrolase n=1 Tax=Limnohabitans radicicola TaxID=2771427 RepID=A0A927ILU3_9BURK|nr:alpha/beta hydrolase [Limnohabitans radicicola]MBD8050302.1 alpha/beta fold hydrolase [Limnohabitans radicicola]